MSFERAFKFFAYATALWAFLMLAIFALLHLPAVVVFLLAFILCLFKDRLGIHPSAGLWLILSMIALLASVYGWFFMGEHLYSVVYLFLYLEINKLWNARRNRDFLHIFGLTFFQVLAASVSTASVFFAPALAMYLFLILGALIMVTVKGDAELALKGYSVKKNAGNHLVVRARDHELDRLQSIYAGRYLTPRFCQRLAGTLFATILIGSGLFFLIPRLQAQYFLGGLPASRASNVSSGFSDLVSFTGVEEIQTNPAIVMRAIPERGYKFSNGLPDIGVLRLRGTALDYYDGRQWRKMTSTNFDLGDSGLRRVVFFPPFVSGDSSPGYYRTTITLEPNRNGYLFGPDRPYRFKLDSLLNLDIDMVAQSVKLRSSNWSIPLRYTVESDIGVRAPTPVEAAPEPTQRERLVRAMESVSTFSLLKKLKNLTGPSELKPYLQLPDHPDIETVRRFAVDWTSKYDSAEQIAGEIERRLKREYAYSLKISFASREDHLTQFLTRERRGHCEYFATAMTLMLRARGIPARIVNGYASDEWVSSGGGYFLVRQEHAHSWVEGYIPGGGWVTFDPTPISGIGNNRIGDTLYRKFSRWVDAMKMIWYNKVIDYNSTDQASMYTLLFRLFDAMPDMQSLTDGIRGIAMGPKDGEPRANRPVLFAITAAIVVLAVFLVREILKLGGFRRPRIISNKFSDAKQTRKVPQYLELLNAVELAHDRHLSQTPREYARQVVRTDGALADFMSLTETYYGARFNGSVWSPGDTEKALVLLRALSQYRRDSIASRKSEISTPHTDPPPDGK